MRQFLLERYRLRIFPVLAVVAVVWLVAGAARDRRHPPAQVTSAHAATVEPVVAEVDAFFAAEWQKLPIAPAGPADNLQILRRLSLALHGTVPSLEEIREFEADAEPQRLERWTARLLADHRFGDYFAERLARALVGVDGGQFIVFRRDRFKAWLSEQLQKNTPYDVLVRQMIAEQGLWTGEPATNFITAAVNEGDVDENKLAGRSVRAFLGQRIDCAQCHDHPFDDWKQQDFEGLAAFYGQVRQTIGISDDAKGEYQIEDRKSREQRTVEPGVPFHPEWLPAAGSRRERLAGWITHVDNRRFERAVANRVWALMFGRGYIEPVDNLPDPPESDAPDLLDILGRDFRAHGCDLKRLVQVIAASKPFRLDSAHPCDDEAKLDLLKERWGVFPLVRLRPEQMIGAILQATSPSTIDQNSHLFVRTIRFFRENDFVKEYGDLGEDELQDRPGTIPQALLRMNGNLIKELTESKPVGSTGRIAGLAANDEQSVEAAFLVCLTRRPNAEESAIFTEQLKGARGKAREAAVEDLLWSLFNSPEFCWNH